MASIEDLMTRNVTEVFDERDPAHRRTAIEAIYADDAGIHAAEGSARGWDGVEAVVRGVLADAEGLHFSVSADPSVVADLGRLTWELAPEGGPPVVRGTDVVIVRDGRIAQLYTFIEPPS
ncbi:hypothetical protein BH10ACT1_BH10ACT1_21470 [soil metagenome]